MFLLLLGKSTPSSYYTLSFLWQAQRRCFAINTFNNKAYTNIKRPRHAFLSAQPYRKDRRFVACHTPTTIMIRNILSSLGTLGVFGVQHIKLIWVTNEVETEGTSIYAYFRYTTLFAALMASPVIRLDLSLPGGLESQRGSPPSVSKLEHDFIGFQAIDRPMTILDWTFLRAHLLLNIRFYYMSKCDFPDYPMQDS